MSEKNLPIKLVLQRTSDTQKNQGGGGIKFFCEVTKELQDVMTEKFEGVLSYYESVFQESELIPAVGKITVRPEAIAKSHKPNDFCRNCPIIGSEDLGEIYIKVSKKGIEDINCIFYLILFTQKFRNIFYLFLYVRSIFL